MGRQHFHLKPLSEQETKDLESFMGQTARQGQVRMRKRGNAVLCSAHGLTVQQISRELVVSERSVWAWLYRYQRYGVAGLLDERTSRLRLTPARVAQITQLKFPDHQPKRTGKSRLGKSQMSYREIAKWIKSRWGVALSHERVRQIILKHLHKSDSTDIIPL